ncbi:MAG: SHOCT domain-containing protein [Patescibacteria group bacterium]|nr:SHOCT domain-containing protein [Patescibacteria group bacterium]MDE2116874.1 SHOCT domain-containing protein [Patescibacteria group bacterium]
MNPFDYGIWHVFDVLFWIVLVIVLISFLRGSRRWRRRGWWDDDNAMNVLKERYAKGEISKEEFEAKKKDLMS